MPSCASLSTFSLHRPICHLIRRAHQIALALFMEETADFDVTPVQFALFNALPQTPGIDQVTLSSRVAFDPATSGSAVGRLEARGWLRRERDPADKRRRLPWVTPEGEGAVQAMCGAAERAQQRLTAPLRVAQRERFVALLGQVVAGHELVSE